MFKSLPPTCQSKSISINYILDISVEMEDVKCSEMLKVSLPVIIIPMTHTESYSYNPPDRWTPTELV